MSDEIVKVCKHHGPLKEHEVYFKKTTYRYDCKKCNQKYDFEYRLKNHEKCKKRWKEYNLKNKEKLKEYRKNNKERIREKQREYQRKRRENDKQPKVA